MKKSILMLLIFNLLVCISHAAIEKIDAVHLVERLMREKAGAKHITFRVEPDSYRTHDAWRVYGAIGQDGVRSLVDAETARVMEVEKNGEAYYRWPGPIVVGHRGHVKYAPENTIPAFAKGVELGVDLYEIDVRQTRDGEMVIMHDSTVDRTTDGSGPVSEMTLAEIKKLDAGSWFGKEFAGTRVPTLREALRFLKSHGKKPDIDFKAGDPEKLVGILRDEGFLDEITCYCGDWNLMAETKKLTDALLYRPSITIGVMGLPIVIQQLDPPIINVDWEQFSEDLIRNIHLAGKKSFVNTMQHDTDFGIESMLDTAPDYIQSDQMDVLMPMLKARGWRGQRP
ncbi:MAG: hypothetical protein GC154_13735 [bacterium]|nr:hypothetical protein [bacterium]